MNSRASNVAGLILAAGRSSRMGSPKALLHYGNGTFLDRLCELFGARCSPVIVVLGANAEKIRASVPASAQVVVNEGWRFGQTSSMKCGLRAIPADAASVLFTLVDHPAVAPATLDVLLGVRGGELLRVPRFGGKRGHPIWISRELIHEFLVLPDDAMARDVVRGHAAETEFLDLDDPGIVADIDDPAAYRSLLCADY